MCNWKREHISGTPPRPTPRNLAYNLDKSFWTVYYSDYYIQISRRRGNPTSWPRLNQFSGIWMAKATQRWNETSALRKKSRLIIMTSPQTVEVRQTVDELKDTICNPQVNFECWQRVTSLLVSRPNSMYSSESKLLFNKIGTVSW